MAKKPRKKIKPQEATIAGVEASPDPRYDLDTLSRAREIQADKRRMSAVKDHAKKQMQAVSGIALPKGKDEQEMQQYAQRRKRIV